MTPPKSEKLENPQVRTKKRPASRWLRTLTGVAIAVAAVVYFGFFFPPPPGDDVTGTIGAVQKYRAEQMSDDDVVLAGEEIVFREVLLRGDMDGDGWRELKDGSLFELTIDVAISGTNVDIGELIADVCAGLADLRAEVVGRLSKIAPSFGRKMAAAGVALA